MVKKWDSLNGFKVSWVYTTQKNHETYVSHISDLILSLLLLYRSAIVDILATAVTSKSFYWLRKKGTTCTFSKSLRSRHVKKIMSHMSHLSQI